MDFALAMLEGNLMEGMPQPDAEDDSKTPKDTPGML